MTANHSSDVVSRPHVPQQLHDPRHVFHPHDHHAPDQPPVRDLVELPLPPARVLPAVALRRLPDQVLHELARLVPGAWIEAEGEWRFPVPFPS